MFCRKCGNKLADDDAFCSKCGAKVTDNSPPPTPPPTPPITDNKPAAARPPSTVKKWLKHPVAKFFLYLIIFVTITILLYAVMLSSNELLMEFITDPRGLQAFIGQCMGFALFCLLMSLPLLIGLTKLKLTKRPHRMEVFFGFMLIHEFGSILFGKKFLLILQPISSVLMLIGLIGLIVLIVAWLKKKKESLNKGA